MVTIHVLLPATIHFLEHEIRFSLPGTNQLDWDSNWKFNPDSWTYQLIQLMMLIASGKVVRLAPDLVDVEDEDFRDEQGLNFYFETDSLGKLIVDLNLIELVRKAAWPKSWEMDSTWEEECPDFAKNTFRDQGTEYWDVHFGSETTPIGHVVLHQDFWTIVNNDKKEMHYQRENSGKEDIIDKYFSHLDRKFLNFSLRDGMFLVVSLEILFQIRDDSWSHN